jgi:hypothetical protein
MDRLVIQAGRALVRAMVSDDWHQAYAAVAGLWSLAYPASQTGGVQAELDELREQVTRARRAGDAAAEQALEGYWQVKLQQLLFADPALASRLQDVLDRVLAPALLSPRAESGQAGQAAAADVAAMRTAVIGQAAAGLTAGAAIIYGSGALTIALRLYFTHLSWEAVLGQIPRDLILTTGFGEIILPAMVIGILGAILLNYLVNAEHSGLVFRVQLRLQRYLTAPPSFGHFLAWLLASAFFGVLEPLVSLYFYRSHARAYFSSKVVISAFEAMATAAVLSALTVGIALILMPAPTNEGLNHGLSAPRLDKPGTGGPGRSNVAMRLRTVRQQVHKLSVRQSARWINGHQPGRVKRTAREITKGTVRRPLVPPAQPPAKASSLGTAAWLAWAATVIGFAVIPGIATFNAATLFPDTAACSTELAGGYLTGTLIATNAGWAYTVEYSRSHPGRDFIAIIPLSSLRLLGIGPSGSGPSGSGVPSMCTVLTQAPVAATNEASGITSSGATLNGSVEPADQATTYRFDYGTTTSYGYSVPSSAGYAGTGTKAVNESANLTGLRPATTYHYRVEATNATGTRYGSDQAFATVCVVATPSIRHERALWHVCET